MQQVVVRPLLTLLRCDIKQLFIAWAKSDKLLISPHNVKRTGHEN